MNTRAVLRLAVLLSLPAIAFAACERQPAPPAETERTAETGITDERPDAWITTSVQAQLYADDAVRGGELDVSTTNGVVTLRGSVEDDQMKQQALTIARSVDGVARVDDRITVQAAGQARADGDRARDDTAATTGETTDVNAGWITTKIQAQYFVNPEVKPWNVDVTTNSTGVVELRGEVDAAEDKAEAVRIARETEGVTRVEDYLRIRGEDRAGATGSADREAVDRDAAAFDVSDAWLTTKVQSKYFLETDVKGRDVDVTTQNGVVTLRGTVESAAERRRAVAIAHNTEGVEDVRDELQVSARAEARDDDPAARGTAGTSADFPGSDAWISTKIQAMYFLDPGVKGHDIDVDTRNGAVTLSGTVESENVKAEAEQIAQETEGVTRVNSRLTVSPAQVQ